MHVYMVFTHYSFENRDIFGITDLHDERATATLYITLEDWVAVLGYPDYMDCHPGDGVTIVSLVVIHIAIVSETESLALKCIV